MINLLGSNKAQIVGVIDPDANAAGTLTTAWIAMKDFEQLLAVIMAGDLGTSATVDAKLQQAQDASGTGAKDVTGKAITQLTQAGTDKSNKQAIINLFSDELDVNGGFDYARLSMTTATATSDSAAIVLDLAASYSGDRDLASVDQIVA